MMLCKDYEQLRPLCLTYDNFAEEMYSGDSPLVRTTTHWLSVVQDVSTDILIASYIIFNVQLDVILIFHFFFFHNQVICYRTIVL